MSAEIAEQTSFVAVGRRKNATARVRMTQGSGKITVNGRPVETYFRQEEALRAATQPLDIVEHRESFDIVVTASGGGFLGQAASVAMGIARALEKYNPELRIPLKRAGLLTRDPRMKERKKAGQPGARKRFQFSKR